MKHQHPTYVSEKENHMSLFQIYKSPHLLNMIINYFPFRVFEYVFITHMTLYDKKQINKKTNRKYVLSSLHR